MRVTVLGCGGSLGVPFVGGDWGDCDPTDPRNYRRRPSVLVEAPDRSGEPKIILIDTPPELREQLLQARAPRIDAVLYTHTHADHTHGLDDLRAYTFAGRAPIPIHAETQFLDELKRRFGYAIVGAAAGPYHPILAPHVIDGPFEAAGVPVVPIAQDHGFGPSTGFRIGGFAYSIDVVRLPEAAFAALEGLDLWIVDCQGPVPYPSHSHLAQTLGWIERLKPRRAVLSHMGQRLDYADLARRLPAGVEPGYDGMVIKV